MTDTRLKPCPFCGGTFVAHGVDGKDMVSVWCKCGARGPDYGFDVFKGAEDINLAYNGWNKRTPAPEAATKQQELYEALELTLDAIGALTKPHELNGYGLTDEDVTQIFAALAKARGES